MNRNDIFNQIIKKKSFLCIGLDPDLNKIPKHLLDFEDPIFEFNKRIINKTKDLCIAYKPNLAFYECLGPKGIKSLEKTINYIPNDIFTIADAKRGDIGNTSNKYAEAFFKNLNFDAITVSPYMGSDSVKPFLEYKNKWVILLALTSNNGSLDFQMLENFEDQRMKVFGEQLNQLYKLTDSSVITTNNLSHITSSNGKRKEQGTNTTINIFDEYTSPFLRDSNSENNHSSQAPINPHPTTGKPTGYISHTSNILLGNATKGKISNRYFRTLRNGKETDF